MSVHFSSQRLDWKTPKSVYQILDAEFHFDHDPCPPKYTVDGLTSSWGGCNYVIMELCDVQYANSKNQLLVSESGQTVLEDMSTPVGYVETNVIRNLPSLKDKIVKKTVFYEMDVQGVLDAKLLKLLATITSHETLKNVMVLTPTVYNVVENTLDKSWGQKETTLLGQVLSKLKKQNIDIQTKGLQGTEQEVLLETIKQEVLSSDGLNETGNDVKLILETNVLVADVTNFLLKTILYLCQMIIVQEQSQRISYHSAKVATQGNTKEILLISLAKESLQKLVGTSQLSIRVVSPATSVYCNPPYGKELPKWIKKGYEEWQKGKTVVFLIPSRTDTIAWHEYCMKATEIRFIKGRLKFDDQKNSAPFPSAIVIFNKVA